MYVGMWVVVVVVWVVSNVEGGGRGGVARWCW